MVQKSDFIAALQFANQELLAFAGELNEADRTTPGLVDRWAARDVLAHVGTSNQEMAEIITAVRRGETPPAGITNEECYHRYKDRPWEEIIALVRKGNSSVLAQVQDLNEEELNAPVEALNGRPLWRNIAATAFLHTIIHIAQSLIDRGERDRAMRINEQSIELGMKIDDSPGWQGLFLYNTGCYLALVGEKQLALENLEKGLRLNPQLVEYSKQDTDLISLHDDAGFLAMLERVAETEQT